jgi:hypothetical protein
VLVCVGVLVRANISMCRKIRNSGMRAITPAVSFVSFRMASSRHASSFVGSTFSLIVTATDGIIRVIMMHRNGRSSCRQKQHRENIMGKSGVVKGRSGKYRSHHPVQ